MSFVSSDSERLEGGGRDMLPSLGDLMGLGLTGRKHYFINSGLLLRNPLINSSVNRVTKKSP